MFLLIKEKEQAVEINNIFDSHAHYDDERYEEDLDTLFQQLHHNGVIGILDVGCSMTAAEKRFLSQGNIRLFTPVSGFIRRKAGRPCRDI